ncbi:efflux RND transporter periplasmic adaptor subunit [Vibrio sp. S4M6]|uniref:efflux RND transporter periplasmic adaptor subunit n=1 Tax=Vibrio sinus TaxID=2946865 RepID=UPI00202A3086|nr:efflux RND transporter periplasmic adaptor subunit [Vibrio sinus]MCL9782806.1 efflux RND transporter periplasmic adaptor subunit [Vibrio sinus]
MIRLANVYLAALVFLIPIGSQAKGPNQAQVISVVTEQVATHQVSQNLTLVGKLEAEQSVDVSSEVAGKVDKIAVSENQNVKQGQLLVQLEDNKALAAVAEAKAYLKDEQRKLNEFERLSKRNAITLTEIDAQKASVEIGKARLDAANANLSDMYIRAPFNGTIGFISFSRGQYVSLGSELMTLDDLSTMRLDLSVPERYLSKLREGMKVVGTSSAWANDAFDGKIRAIDTRINPETLNMKVRIQFDNRLRKLKPGMLLSVDIQLPSITAPIIPVQALEYSGTKRYVYVIDKDNKATRTEVWLGARVGNQVVIEKGLSIGEKVVVQGIVNMRDGVTVTEVDKNGKPVKKEA